MVYSSPLNLFNAKLYSHVAFLSFLCVCISNFRRNMRFLRNVLSCRTTDWLQTRVIILSFSSRPQKRENESDSSLHFWAHRIHPDRTVQRQKGDRTTIASLVSSYYFHFFFFFSFVDRVRRAVCRLRQKKFDEKRSNSLYFFLVLFLSGKMRWSVSVLKWTWKRKRAESHRKWKMFSGRS